MGWGGAHNTAHIQYARAQPAGVMRCPRRPGRYSKYIHGVLSNTWRERPEGSPGQLDWMRIE